MNHDVDFQNIFDQIEEFLPVNWNKVIFYAEYGKNSYSMEFYTAKEGGEYTKCFALPGVNRADLLKLFQEINLLIRKKRDTITSEKLWSNMTMTVEHSGAFKVDYDYTDLLENAYEYKNLWKEKYLAS